MRIRELKGWKAWYVSAHRWVLIEPNNGVIDVYFTADHSTYSTVYLYDNTATDETDDALKDVLKDLHRGWEIEADFAAWDGAPVSTQVAG